jgi:hypothetical protein
MDWLGAAVAIGLIVVVSGLFSAVQGFQRERRARDVRSGREHAIWEAIEDATHAANGHGHGHHHSAPPLDDALHLKLDQLLERVPRSTFWRNTLWAITGYGLAKLADFGLYFFFGL